MKKAHLGMKQMPRVWKVCMMVWNKWQMFWNKHTFEGCPHCTTNGFFQDGICVVWVCFVPLSMAVHIVYCFQVYSYTTWTTQYLFYNQQRVENCIVCHWLHTTNGFVLYYWNFFCSRIRQYSAFHVPGFTHVPRGFETSVHILSYWARDSKDLGFRSQRRGVA